MAQKSWSTHLIITAETSLKTFHLQACDKFDNLLLEALMGLDPNLKNSNKWTWKYVCNTYHIPTYIYYYILAYLCTCGD